MKYVSLILLALTGCAQCHLATGVQYEPNTMYIEQVLWGSPADKAGIKVGDFLIVADGGHLFVARDGEVTEYHLAQVCVEPKTRF